MAVWDRISSRGEVDDRRGFAPVVAGSLGLTGLVIAIAFSLLTGVDVGDTLEQLQSVQGQQSQVVDSGEFQGADSYEVFASTVLGSVNDAWYEILGNQNITYDPPKLVLFREATQSGCGVATSSTGPHYCPIDQDIYLDETFFDELESFLGAEGGDVAQAYVIAHEVGHHVQNQLGIFDRADARTNEGSIKIELQADCYAGLWANSIKDRNILEVNEIREAMDTAAAIGDDRIQEKSTGQVNPETWTHGSSDQRVFWFSKGYSTGDFNECNTF
jgi:predicted metalloprotease